MLSGIPGLSDLPLIGRLFANNRTETRETDIILTLTPHIVRVLDLSEADLEPFLVRGDAGAPIAELPVPIPRDRIDLPESMQPPVEDPSARPLNPFFPYPLPSASPGVPVLPGTTVPVTPPKKPGGG